MKSYFEQDFEGFVGDLIDTHFVKDGDRLLVFIDGRLHHFNGTHYEPVDISHRGFMTQVREYVKKLPLTNKRRKRVQTPTSPSFYKNILKTMEALCSLNANEKEAFRLLDKDLVFGKTKVYRISAREFEPHSHKNRNRFVLGYDVAEDDHEPEVWQEFFAAAQMDEKQQRSLWRQLSVIVMRDNRHHRIFYCIGNPRSGKGTIIAIATDFFGRSGVAALPRTISSGSHDAAVIVGKALLTINDMKFDKHVNSSFIQILLNLVGEDAITINPKHKDMFDYYPEANIMISSNEVPNFRGNLSGLENKFVFNVFQRGEKPVDLTLRQRMLDTMPHIIRKAIKMYPETVESGYDFDTERGKLIRDQFAESASVAIRYIEECCILGEGFNDGSDDIFDSFLEYAKKQNEHKPTQSQFQNEIMTHFLGKIGKKRIINKVGKKVTVLTGIHRIGQGNTIDDPKPVPPGLMAPKSAQSNHSVSEEDCRPDPNDVPF